MVDAYMVNKNLEQKRSDLLLHGRSGTHLPEHTCMLTSTQKQMFVCIRTRLMYEICWCA